MTISSLISSFAFSAVRASAVGSVIDGTPERDQLVGTLLDDTIRGHGGNDNIAGLNGDDLLDGGAGNDLMWGDNGNDILLGGEGADILHGNAGNDTLDGGSGPDTLDGGEGNDHLIGGDGDDKLTDEEGDDLLEGGNGNDTIRAGIGAAQDTSLTRVDGGAGDDWIEAVINIASIKGGSGNDTIRVVDPYRYHPPAAEPLLIDAGAGDDHIHLLGMTGRTVLATGGAGIDTYHLGNLTLAQRLTITDFTPGAGGDVIDVYNLFDIDASAGNPFGESARLRLEQRGADTMLQYRPKDASAVTDWWDLVLLKNTLSAELRAANFSGAAPHNVPKGIELTGTAGNDRLNGATLDDTLRGGAGDDILTGGGGHDLLYGDAGNDTLRGGAGVDQLFGGEGIDSALYSGKRASYTVTADAAGIEVVDLRGPAGDGRDLLSGVERLIFSDTALAFDVDGAAGQAYRIYRAAFDRAPDPEGLGFWIARLDTGTTLESMAEGFSRSREFIEMYGLDIANAEIVLRLYRNILDRAPEPEGYAFWVDVLDNQSAGIDELLAAFSESQENQDAVAALVGNGIPYTPYGA